MPNIIQRKFCGRDREDARREARRYWEENRDMLGLSLREFCDRCVSIGRHGETIVFVDRDLQLQRTSA
jgi:hypothetical protein